VPKPESPPTPFTESHYGGVHRKAGGDAWGALKLSSGHIGVVYECHNSVCVCTEGMRLRWRCGHWQVIHLVHTSRELRHRRSDSPRIVRQEVQ